MSYDVLLEIDTGGEQPATVSQCRTPTYNLGPMFVAALGVHLLELDGRTGAEAAPLIRVAIERMQDKPKFFEALNPRNGCGNYDEALRFFRVFLADCLAHPRATVRV